MVTSLRERKLSELAPKFRAILQGGEDYTVHGYTTAFRARRAVVLSAIRRGWTLDDCYRAFLSDPTSPAWDLWGSSRSDIGKHGRYKRLSEDYRVESAFAASTPAPVYDSASAKLRVADLIGQAKDADWHGIAGRTDRDVLSVLHGYGLAYASLTVLAPNRKVGLQAGVGEKTVGRSLKRLVRASWLHPAGAMASWLTGRYTLTVPELSHTDAYQVSVVVDSDMRHGGTTFPGHECWVAMGKSALAVWIALDETPRTVRDIASRAGVAKSTGHRALSKLAKFGLAASDGDGWDKRYTLGNATPDDVAISAGFTIVADRRKLYDAQRAAWDKQAQADNPGAASKSYEATVPATTEHIQRHIPDPTVKGWNDRMREMRELGLIHAA